MLFSLQTSRLLLAQPEAPAWTAPAWIISPAEVKQYFKSEYFRDKNALKSVNPGGDQIKQIKRIVRAFLSLLTQENKASLPKLVADKLLNDLHQQLTSAAARQIGMEETVALAPDLMTFPDDLVRYNMLAILAQLSVKQTQQMSGGTEIPAVPFNPAHKVFIQVVQDPKQNLGCRILAARGLLRICRDGENAPSSNEKSDIATVLVNTLAANPPSTNDGTWWFRLRLIEALGAVDRLDNTATQPIVVEGLLDVIIDQKEVWLNRSIAAQCITQLPYSSSTNVPLITTEILNLLTELSREFNKAPSAPELREPFKRIYLAFRPASQRQAKEKKWGLLYEVERTGLGSNAPYVKGAWQVAFPILRPFVESGSLTEQLPAIPAAEIQALAAWIQQNPPTSRQVMPSGKVYPLRTTQPQAAVEAASN